ncbi:valine--tRNA ligase [Pseudoxanthomonas mexicana]|uniref:valine--tRNA ligase n=1 Tax=Pseudoxanthomonas mexicana TaxID=128785 RepID=UPI001FD66C4A|nr:valine--tRNA ligase [Pseudoxanthomonas mexicana]UOV00710.1 valine--tRNA ligase [Pseudoxanthomonas mexicana]
MTDLASSYDPKSFESRLYAQWEAAGYFKPSGKGEPYTVLLPPPNVTGTLHMGHAFQHTLMDALVRYHRMRGYDTLWQMGTDHAGIATEMVVSRNLALEGQGETRDSLGRDGFIAKVWEWKAQSGDTIERQMRRMGASGDWSRSTFTMDEQASKAVIEAFVRWHEQGLIYRGQRLVNWDPVLKTAISDLEVENVEEDGFLWSIEYPLADGSGSLVVATTRPETMLGDTAVMVHPEDERYAHLIGKMVKLPLTEREIPVIADDYVDREFGTGVVKVTPAHDFNDYQVGLRHGLPLINLLTPTAAINENAPEKYRGLDRYEARKAVLADLEDAGLLVETKPHKLQVPRGDRTGQVIEPYLTDQWFVKMDGLAKRGLELVESGEVKFVPPNWINTYRHWMENIQDWCISRQLWWGHRIPAWFDDAGNCYVGRDEAEARAKAGLSADVALTQDSDVLETWFSSQLWPFSTMGWPDEQAMAARGFDRYLPSSVLVTGFDIIFFWVARMVMATDSFVGQVPFRDVYMTGLIRDKDGQKMSKSKGNVLDPLDIIDGISLEDLVAKRTGGLMQPKMAEKIEKATRKEFPDGIVAHGADALRFTIAALATHGRDIKFDMGRAEGYKNFCNKLWNATRFVLGSLPEVPTPEQAFERGDLIEPSPIIDRPEQWPATDFEKWILSRLKVTVCESERHFKEYRFDLLAQTLYDFTWNQFCDWFLEMSKPFVNAKVAVDLAGEGELTTDIEKVMSFQYTLAHVLESLLRLLHPLTPFVTEELWHQVAPRLGTTETTISLRAYPQPDDFASTDYATAEADVEWFKDVISELRKLRSSLGISPSRTVDLLLGAGHTSDQRRIAKFDNQIRFLAKLNSIRWLKAGEVAPPSAAGIPNGTSMVLNIPLEGLVDLDAERARLDKEIARVSGEKDKSEAKLAKFTDKVPPAVVEQERQRLADWSSQLAALHAQRAKL